MSSLVNKSYTNKYKSKLGNESSMTEAILAAAKKTNMCIRFEEKAAIVSNTLIVDVHDILSSSNTRDLEEKLDIANAFLNSIFTFVESKDNMNDDGEQNDNNNNNNNNNSNNNEDTVNMKNNRKQIENRLIKQRAYQDIILRLQTLPIQEEELKQLFNSRFNGTRKLSNRDINMFVPTFKLSAFFTNGDLKSMAKIENINAVNNLLVLNSRKFGYSCGIPKMYKIMSSHPKYMEMELKSFDMIFKNDGPLPIIWRQYIAIMAASRYNCDYLVYLHRRQFLLSGGDPTWLLGLHNVPKKLQRLLNINAILAHQPWLINTDDVAHLVEEGSSTFSIPELLLCLCIMSSVHAQAGFILGMGILLEQEDVIDGNDILDWGNIKKSNDKSDNTATSNAQKMGNIKKKNETIDESLISSNNNANNKNISRVSSGEDMRLSPRFSNSPPRPKTKKTIDTGNVDDNEDFDDAEILNRLGEDIEELIENDDRKDEDVFEKVEGAIHIKQEKQGFARLSVYCGDDGLDYEDFDQKKQPFLQSQEFSWGEQCHAFLGRYFPDLADHLDEQFEYIYEMTYNTFGDKKTDKKTGAFRRAVWYYTHRLLGIRNDDYEYKEVNLVLTRPIKQYLKTACCYPETVTVDDFVRFSSSLSVGEKCHINLLLLEARKQAALMYGIRAVVAFR